MRGNETPGRIVTNFCTGVGVHDVITSVNFYDCRLWGLSVVGGQILGFSIDSRRRPYNTLALPCECVIKLLLLLLLTFIFTLAAVVGPWVWGWCQNIVSAALNAKTKAWTFEARTKVKVIGPKVKATSPGFKDYISAWITDDTLITDCGWNITHNREFLIFINGLHCDTSQYT